MTSPPRIYISPANRKWSVRGETVPHPVPMTAYVHGDMVKRLADFARHTDACQATPGADGGCPGSRIH